MKLSGVKKFFFIILAASIGLEFGIRLAERAFYTIFEKVPKHIFKVDENAFRIICLGESYVAGNGASDFSFNKFITKNAFPAQLEKLLLSNFPNRKIQVFNLGVCGTTAVEIYKNLKFNLKYFKPHLIIYLAGTNGHAVGPYVPCFVKNKNIFIRFVRVINDFKIIRFIKFLKYITEVISNKFYYDDNKFIRILSHTFVHHRLNSKSMNNVSISYKLDKSYNIKPETKTWDSLLETLKYLKEKKYNIILCNYFNSKANERLKNLSEVVKIPFCDNEKMYKEYKKTSTEKLLGEDNWHPNDKGYMLIARNIYNKIISEGLLLN